MKKKSTKKGSRVGAKKAKSSHFEYAVIEFSRAYTEKFAQLNFEQFKASVIDELSALKAQASVNALKRLG